MLNKASKGPIKGDQVTMGLVPHLYQLYLVSEFTFTLPLTMLRLRILW